MADESGVSDEISVLSRKLESINANDSNQNVSERLENNQRTSTVNMNPVFRSNLRSEHDKREEKLPAINLPEKILIVVDTVRENNCTQFEFGSGAKYMPLQMIKRVIDVFVRVKGTMNRKHEYALMMLTADSAEYLCDYTNDEKKISSTLHDLNDTLLSGKHEYSDLSPCLSEIFSQCPIGTGVENPSYVHRVILIYSRSNSVPKLTTSSFFGALMDKKYFFFDVLFVHEPPTDENNCEKIYRFLSTLDIKQNSWILEVGRNAAQLHAAMAKLLAHPLQRPKQNDAEYKVFFDEVNEKQTNV